MSRGRGRQTKADPREAASRQDIVDGYRWMVTCGLTQGTSGNLSVRLDRDMLITPSGVPPDDLGTKQIARMPLDACDGSWSGPLRPSTEWRFHRDILKSRPDIGAVVHAHSPYATALAMARREIPACHYMIALFGGDSIRCAGYALFGTQVLSDRVIEALQDRQGCLLANHGMVTIGPTLKRALWLALELETLARQYILSLAAGGPVLLGSAEMAEAHAAIGGYGQANSPDTREALPRSTPR
jgi:L-fuculose-phosphate aldolase